MQIGVLVLIMGLFVGSTVSFISVRDNVAKEQLTRDRMKRIAVLLSDYAQRKGFLPCPSAANTSIGNSRICSALASSRDGIVPYREIGLSQKDIIDGYGNPFTYGVSNAATSSGLGTTIDGRCRKILPLSFPWIWFDVLTLSYKNYNSMKSRFCCQSVLTTNAIQVRVSAAGASVTTTQNGFSGLALPIIPVTILSTTVTTYFAYALVSHGKNGRGSYTIGSAARKSTTGASADEIENADANNIYIARTPALMASTGFDDIVLWRTQEQTIAEVNNDTCSRP